MSERSPGGWSESHPKRREVMAGELEEKDIPVHQRDQMLKLVTRGFYRELRRFGVETKEILKVASHLLDNLLSKSDLPESGISYHNGTFNLDSVEDDWEATRTMAVQEVLLRPLQTTTVPSVARWLADPAVRESFVPAFPGSEQELQSLFSDPSCQYFEVVYEGAPVGIVGGEHIDGVAGKVEMKKLVGEPGMQGKGIGKRATFGFLYYAFMILGMNKVYIHSRDINIRNINLNRRFGFELEGVFYEDLWVDGRRSDVIRMALLKQPWLEVFSSPESTEMRSPVMDAGV
jgi:RimJ/RimL family protein N-acetyltransferase